MKIYTIKLAANYYRRWDILIYNFGRNNNIVLGYKDFPNKEAIYYITPYKQPLTRLTKFIYIIKYLIKRYL